MSAAAIHVRTTVYVDAGDPDRTDEFPGCFGTVDEDGTLTLVDLADSTIEHQYEPTAWSSYDVTNEGSA